MRPRQVASIRRHCRVACQVTALAGLFVGAAVWGWVSPVENAVTSRRLEMTMGERTHVEEIYEEFEFPELVAIDVAGEVEGTCQRSVSNADLYSEDKLRELASGMGIDFSRFKTCVASSEGVCGGDCSEGFFALTDDPGWNGVTKAQFNSCPGSCCMCKLGKEKICDGDGGDCRPSIEVLKDDHLSWLPGYCFGIFYMFVSLAIVCDEFFVPSLEVFVDKWEVSMDVAGATFMAAGGSAPELFTSFIGTFKESDVGFGTIVGSAVFNVLFVIGVCAIASKDVLELTWWPLARDCSYYTLALSVLAIFFRVSSPNEIEWWEALVLFLLYLGYVTLMRNSEDLRKWVEGFLGTEVVRLEEKEEDCKGGGGFEKPSTFRAGVLTLLTQNGEVTDTMGVHAVSQVKGNCKATFMEFDANRSGFIEREELSALLTTMGCTPSAATIDDVLSKIDSDKDGKISLAEFTPWYAACEKRLEAEMGATFKALDEDGNGVLDANEISNMFSKLRLPLGDGADVKAVIGEMDKSGKGVVSKEDFEAWYMATLFWKASEAEAQEGGEDEDDGAINPFDVPENAVGRLWWFFTLPIALVLWATLPDVRRPERHTITYAMGGFVGSIIWIGMFSFCMVDWATLVSNTLGVPVAVAGLTVLAAGTSVPDLLSSVIVARQGEGDMAVSSSVGSNIFDVLVGLPLPWFTFSVINSKVVKVRAESLGVSVLVLILMLVTVVMTIKCCGWRMTRAMGYSMFLLYIVFVAQDLARQLPRGDPLLPSF